MNQKQGLTDRVSCSTMEIPERKKNLLTLEQTKTPVEPQWTKQQTRSSGPNQLK